MNFDSSHLESISSRRKTRAVLSGVEHAGNYNIHDRVSICVEGKPLAEGIIRSVVIESIGQIVSDGVKSGEKTTEKMAALNEYCLARLGKQLNMRSVVTVIGWEYV